MSKVTKNINITFLLHINEIKDVNVNNENDQILHKKTTCREKYSRANNTTQWWHDYVYLSQREGDGHIKQCQEAIWQ